MVNAFDERLFRILFKTYSKKVWDVDTKELDGCFASQRIQKMDLYQAIKYAIKSIFVKPKVNTRMETHITYPKKRLRKGV